MNRQNILGELLRLGLDSTEAKIYLHLVEFGPITPLKLSREISINRTKIYRYIDRLKKLGLIEDSNVGWGLELKAASPQNFAILIQQKEKTVKEQKDILDSLVNQVSHLPTFSKREFEIQHYFGQEGLKQMMWNQLSAKKEILQFAFETRNEAVGKKYAELIRQNQVDRRIKLYEIENATDQGDYWYTDVGGWANYYDSRHIPSRILTIKQNFSVFNNTLSIMNWHENTLVGIEITNTYLAQMQEKIFWTFWEIAKKYQKKKTAKK